jgi:hypothetical protein
MNPTGLPPQAVALIQMLAQGVLQQFVQHFPTGVANPATPIIVQRETAQGPIMQQTTFAQLVAEQIDESKKLRKSIDDLSDLTEEALETTTKRRGRR